VHVEDGILVAVQRQANSRGKFGRQGRELPRLCQRHAGVEVGASVLGRSLFGAVELCDRLPVAASTEKGLPALKRVFERSLRPSNAAREQSTGQNGGERRTKYGALSQAFTVSGSFVVAALYERGPAVTDRCYKDRPALGSRR